MNYSEMTDFQINKAVGDASGVEWASLDSNYHPLSIWNDGDLCVFCPCNSWADAGPIIASNLIAIKPVALYVGGHRWFAIKGEGDFGLKTADNNPLRAAMIVFLMMQENPNA